MPNFKDHVSKVLNGVSSGIVISLLPFALLGQLSLWLNLPNVNYWVNATSSLMCLIIGMAIAMQYKLDVIESATLAISSFFAGQALKMRDGVMVLAGTGDVLNTIIGASVAIILIFLLKDRIKAYKILIFPSIVILFTTFISSATMPIISIITGSIGSTIQFFTTLQPYLMSILIAMAFSLIIISPISTVAISLAINLEGYGSAAANIGVVSVGLSMAMLSYRNSGLGTSLIHFIGSPKLQMANFIKKPIIILPGMLTAALSSIFVPILNMQGTSLSAGFGASGFLGSVTHMALNGYTFDSIVVGLIGFIFIPLLIAAVVNYVVIKYTSFLHFDDFQLNF